MTAYALFFRGLNVGGHRLTMADLRDLLTGLGGQDVQTILQSGSAVLRHELTDPAALESLVEAAFAERFGYKSATHARTLAEVESVLSANPFPEFAAERPNHTLAFFGAAPFGHDDVAVVQSATTGPESLRAVGRELYITFPDGIGVSTLPKVKGYNRLVGQATARNWNTVVKVRDALRGLA